MTEQERPMGEEEQTDLATLGLIERTAAPEQTDATMGATAQDDPFLAEYYPYPVQGEEGEVTLVAVFEDMEHAHSCARDLERRGIEVGLVARRGDGPEQGMRPGNVITGPDYGLSAPNQSPPRDRPMGAGVAVGATLGATAGFVAATYFVPPLGLAFATGSLVSTLAGAGLGSFLGGLAEYGAAEHDDDASFYAGQVRRGGVLLMARVTKAQADETRRLLGIWNPLEIRVQ